jgi:hypothetical protein
LSDFIPIDDTSISPPFYLRIILTYFKSQMIPCQVANDQLSLFSIDKKQGHAYQNASSYLLYLKKIISAELIIHETALKALRLA